MTPPDSGEREVPAACRYDVREWQSEHRREWHRGHGCIYDGVMIPESLAQRILAALEGESAQYGYAEFAALASELRAVVERKGAP